MALRARNENTTALEARRGRSLSTAEATCSSATADPSNRFRTFPPSMCWRAAITAPSQERDRVRRDDSARQPGSGVDAARHAIRRGRVRRRSPTTCCAGTSSRVPSTRVTLEAIMVLALGIAITLLVAEWGCRSAPRRRGVPGGRLAGSAVAALGPGVSTCRALPHDRDDASLAAATWLASPRSGAARIAPRTTPTSPSG